MNQTSCTVAGCTCNLADINWREPLCCYSVHEYEQPCPRQSAPDLVEVAEEAHHAGYDAAANACTDLLAAARAVVEAVDKAYYWHDVHERNEPGHHCGFAAGYTWNINVKERVAALRAAIEEADRD